MIYSRRTSRYQILFLKKQSRLALFCRVSSCCTYVTQGSSSAYSLLTCCKLVASVMEGGGEATHGCCLTAGNPTSVMRWCVPNIVLQQCEWFIMAQVACRLFITTKWVPNLISKQSKWDLPRTIWKPGKIYLPVLLVLSSGSLPHQCCRDSKESKCW